MNLEEYKKRIGDYKPNKFSYFRENMKLLLNTYPQALENLGMWRRLVSQADLDPDQFREIIEHSKTIPLPYSRIGNVRKTLYKNRKRKVIPNSPQMSIDFPQ